jgi:hypothetical protein
LLTGTKVDIQPELDIGARFFKSMITAILIGQGPEVAALLARTDLLSDNLTLFRTSVSGATLETASRESARETLLARNVSVETP